MASRSAAIDAIYNQDTSIENTFKLRSLRQSSIDPNKNIKLKDVNLNFNMIIDDWKQNTSVLNDQQQIDDEVLQYLFDCQAEKCQLPQALNQQLRGKKISSSSVKKIRTDSKDESPILVARPRQTTCMVCHQGFNDYFQHIQNVHHRKRCEKSIFESEIKKMVEYDRKNYEQIKSMKMSENQYLQSLCRPKKKRHTQSTQPTLNRFTSIRSDSQEQQYVLPKIADGVRSIFSGLN